MSKIILLDEHTANKIAAGEVVERPASVVKELIENAIDAGSSRVEVSVTDGGLTEIVVSDNGTGMDAADAGLAFERHATSKITSASDLEGILTLGFRGEALPSIAAVSRLNLRTRTADSVCGTEISIEGGRVVKKSETGCPQGTVIRVNELFYNIPARKKHMKSPTAEAGHVSEIVNKFAMGYPQISFQLVSNGRTVLKTGATGNLLDCIAAVYGPEYAREMLPVCSDNPGNFSNTVGGYIGKPSLSRSGRNHQIIYVNGRYVRNRNISEAVEKAYHGMMMTGRFPVFVLDIKTDPRAIDVNVHPAKTEIRLSGEFPLMQYVTDCVVQTLSAGNLVPEAREYRIGKKELEKHVVQESLGTGQVCFPAGPARDSIVVSPERLAGMDKDLDTDKVFGIELNEGSGFPELRPLGQVDFTYIVAQSTNGMYLIDQHAAHERVLYETYMARTEEYTASEQLLFPINLQLTHLEAQTLNDSILALVELGYVIEHFGRDDFLIRAAPAGISKNGAKEIFLDLLDYFSHYRYTITGKELREKFTVMMACKNAIKANHRLGLPEMESVLARLAKARNPYTCPHGRPTMIHFSGYELQKRFKRVL